MHVSSTMPQHLRESNLFRCKCPPPRRGSPSTRSTLHGGQRTGINLVADVGETVLAMLPLCCMTPKHMAAPKQRRGKGLCNSTASCLLRAFPCRNNRTRSGHHRPTCSRLTRPLCCLFPDGCPEVSCPLSSATVGCPSGLSSSTAICSFKRVGGKASARRPRLAQALRLEWGWKGVSLEGGVGGVGIAVDALVALSRHLTSPASLNDAARPSPGSHITHNLGVAFLKTSLAEPSLRLCPNHEHLWSARYKWLGENGEGQKRLFE